ncbi:MAG: hypothetical protein NTW19_06020 [Planctomycetota bacterium]|nr:hypothetical protein [Planctomycetota bacterium]
MRTVAEPPLADWRLAPFTARGAASPVIATGHQAWLWHPGILAKDLAMVAAAKRLNATTFHLIVDHDVHEALRLELPVLDGERLTTQTLHLGPENIEIPSGSQPPVDAGVARRTLEAARQRWGKALCVDVGPLIDAFDDLPPSRTLAEQMRLVTAKLLRPWTGEVPILQASALAKMPPFEPLVRAMLADARGCVHAYNRAVARHPEARVAPLGTELDRVELPLWAVADGRPRRRVFADLSDSRGAELALENGEIVGAWERANTAGLRLAPRAILMSAFLRRWCCDLFVHGKGGAVYDQVTEAWWSAWRGEALAPKAVVSADLHLAFDAPLAEPAERNHALWYAHHLRHNIDRGLAEGDARVARKRELLASVERDHDKARRAAAFAEIHRINDALAADHAELLDAARAAARRTEVGLANRAIAGRRDWCFALYPAEQLAALRDAF